MIKIIFVYFAKIGTISYKNTIFAYLWVHFAEVITPKVDNVTVVLMALYLIKGNVKLLLNLSYQQD